MRPNNKSVYRRLMILKYVIIHSYRNPPINVFGDINIEWTESEKKDFDNNLKQNAKETISSLKSFKLWKYVSREEKNFIQSSGSSMDEKAQMNTIWRMEAAGMLMWVLNLLNEWPEIDEQLNPELLKNVEIKKLRLFASDLYLRPIDEINKKRDLIEMWHWRVNTRRLIENGFKYEPDENMKKAGLNSLEDIVRITAKSAYENGDIKEIKEEDFTFKGKPFRDLNTDEFNEATSIIIERHYGLNWICGYAPKNDWDKTPTDT